MGAAVALDWEASVGALTLAAFSLTAFSTSVFSLAAFSDVPLLALLIRDDTLVEAAEMVDLAGGAA